MLFRKAKALFSLAQQASEPNTGELLRTALDSLEKAAHLEPENKTVKALLKKTEAEVENLSVQKPQIDVLPPPLPNSEKKQEIESSESAPNLPPIGKAAQSLIKSRARANELANRASKQIRKK